MTAARIFISKKLPIYIFQITTPKEVEWGWQVRVAILRARMMKTVLNIKTPIMKATLSAEELYIESHRVKWAPHFHRSWAHRARDR